MPFPKNWLEELAAEWLTICGHMVESNVRLKSKPKGSTGEADVVGVRTKNGVLEIVHIETGGLSNNLDKNIAKVNDQAFREAKCKEIQDLFKKRMGWEDKIGYTRIFIADYVSKKGNPRGRLKHGIEFLTFEEFIRNKVFPDIEKWKVTQQEYGLRKTANITIPDSLWLLKFLDVLRSKGLLVLNSRPPSLNSSREQRAG